MWKETNGAGTLINSLLKYQTTISTDYGVGAFCSWKYGVFAPLSVPFPVAARIHLRAMMFCLFVFCSTCRNQAYNQGEKAKPSGGETSSTDLHGALGQSWAPYASPSSSQQATKKKGFLHKLAPQTCSRWFLWFLKEHPSPLLLGCPIITLPKLSRSAASVAKTTPQWW